MLGGRGTGNKSAGAIPEKTFEKASRREYWRTGERVSREELCRLVGVRDIKTLLRERRVAFAGHLSRDKAEGTFDVLSEQMRRRTQWGKAMSADLDYYGVEIERLFVGPEYSAPEIRQILREKRAAAPPSRPEAKKKKEEKGRPTQKMRDARAKRRERIQQQQAEQRAEREGLLTEIDGKKWKRKKGRVHTAVGGGGPAREFRVKAEAFNENEGREELEVEGVWFYRDAAGRYWRT